MALELHFTDEKNKGLVSRLADISVIGKQPGLGNRVGDYNDSIGWIELFKRWNPDHEEGTPMLPAIESYRKRQFDLKIEGDVSDVHALLRPVGDKFEILDLASSGTYVNGKKLEPFSPYTISDGDTLELGEACAKATYVDTEKFNRALFVVNPANNLDIPELATRITINELVSRGFIVSLLYDGIEEEQVMSALQNFRELRREQSFLFFYSGHGKSSGPDAEEGVLCLDRRSEISAGEFYKATAQIKAKQMHILECCYGGLWLDHPEKPTRTAVLTATRDNDVCYGVLSDAFTAVLFLDEHRVQFDNALVERLAEFGMRRRGYKDQQAGIDETSTTNVVIPTQDFKPRDIM